MGGTVADCSSQVLDLGVIFDRVLSLRQHVNYTSKTCRFDLRNISRIMKYLPQDTSVVLFKSIGNVETGLCSWFVVWAP